MTEQVEKTDFRVESTHPVGSEQAEPERRLHVPAKAIDAAIRAFTEVFGRTVDGREIPEGALAGSRRSLHRAIGEFTGLGGPASAAGAPMELTLLRQAIDVAADGLAQARLSRSRGWVTSVDDKFELRRRELFSAILDYCTAHRAYVAAPHKAYDLP